MTSETQDLQSPPQTPDYSLVGINSTLAVEKGLAEAEWYQCAVPRATMRTLLERCDGPAILNTMLWFTLIFASGFATRGMSLGAPPLAHSFARPAQAAIAALE